MKPETMMKPRPRMLMPVNHLLTSADSRAPRTSIPVGEMEYETFQDLISNQIHRHRKQTSSCQRLGGCEIKMDSLSLLGGYRVSYCCDENV